LSGVRTELEAQERLALADASRQTLQERVRALTEDDGRLADRLARLETAPQLEIDTGAQLAQLRAASTAADEAHRSRNEEWLRDRGEAENRLESLRLQYTELAQQKSTLEELGPESPCPTCSRPLGASYTSVMELVVGQLETVRAEGNYYRQRVEQLSKTPESLLELEAKMRAAQAEVSAQERRLARIHDGLVERRELGDHRSQLLERKVAAERALQATVGGFDAELLRALRQRASELTDVEKRAARLGADVDRSARLERDAAEWRDKEARARQGLADLERAGVPELLDDHAFSALRAEFERAASRSQRAELEVVSAASDVERARADVEHAQRSQNELVRLEARVAALDGAKRLHDELDRTFGDLRTDLNFQLRPELADVASVFLDSLTDGRYAALEFDEDFTPIVLEDGVAKPVISGGEEDLCNLVLRLAISQMIAERAGQHFSLLVLDEVFGSLDEVRRINVVELLRRLHDRFEQVIVITHIEQVREGLDRVLVVRRDDTSGISTVVDGARIDGAENDVGLDVLTPTGDDAPARAGVGYRDEEAA
jgi:exonuclease SbcC